MTDLARSTAFYRDRLGLAVEREIPGFAFLAAGGVTLALSEPVGRARQPLAGAVVVVFGVRDVRASYAELVERGIAFDGPPFNMDGVNWGANFRDPDGHILSIFGPEGAA